jgi:hypothetical protein
MSRSKRSGEYRQPESPMMMAMGDKPGYTPASGQSAAASRCRAGGGKWVNGRCVGGSEGVPEDKNG